MPGLWQDLTPAEREARLEADKLQSEATGRDPITVSCAYPPIPIRDWDFCVYRDPEKPSTYGWGRTSAEALDDFTRLELEEACYAECGDATDEDSGCQLAARGYGGKCPLRVLEERRAKR